ncbi:hypothetical protein HKX48_004212 [Thoreauomyces humboldtii]|nr:hypothetical protein HKX48_004212 [Thoreauomyces humboldtii]
MLVKTLASFMLLAASASSVIALPISSNSALTIGNLGRRDLADLDILSQEVQDESVDTSSSAAAPAVATTAEASAEATAAASPVVASTAAAATPTASVSVASASTTTPDVSVSVAEQAPATASSVPDVTIVSETGANGTAVTPATAGTTGTTGTTGSTGTTSAGSFPGVPVAAVPAAAASPAAADLFVLNYALTLEHLEATFYQTALAKFSAADFKSAGFDPAIRDQFLTVQSHEDTHVTALTSVINATFGAGMAVPPCEYNFAFDTVGGFIATAAALERTGVQAYTGALKFVSADAIKTAAATIATVEGRHAAALNVINTAKVNGVVSNVNPIPGAFDTALGFTPVFSIAAPFIKSCPFPLPVTPFPSLTLSKSTGNFQDNLGLLFTATLTAAQIAQPASLHCAVLFGLAQKRTPVTITMDPRSGGMLANCEMPIDALGNQELMVFVVNADMDVTIDSDKHVIAGPATFTVLEAAKIKVKTA